MEREDLAMTATVEDPSGSSGAPRSGADTAAAGRIGRFVVLEMLGQGAMGVVYAAYDPDLERKVALKLLRTGLEDGSRPSLGTERMVREARAMAKLAHPNVLAVYEVGTAGNRVFIATEMATGGTLRAWIAEPRPWRAVLDMFLQAARGLDAAHRVGLVHRDFKPENVLLTGDGRARVADFGLVGTHAGEASAAPESEPPLTSSADATLTRTGVLLGTPAYMAPEQHERAAVGPAADQFALCVALWEGLYGVRPFIAATLPALAEKVAAGRIDEPPADRDVPRWLRDAVQRGLAPQPEDRWPSVEALIAALEHDPAARVPARRGLRVALVAGAAALAGVGAFALSRTAGVRDTRCSGMDGPLAGVWDPARAAVVRDAFAGTGRAHAATTVERVSTALDGYTRDWVRVRVEVCEATHTRGVQSGALLDLRMACLDRRLADVGALVEVFATRATPDVVDRATTAVAKLPPLTGCDDVEALQATVPPPDAETREQVDALRVRMARAQALSDAGEFRDALPLAQAAAIDAERLGYAPALAEALHLRGGLEAINGDANAADATLEAALLAAAAARDDRLTATIWTDRLNVIAELAARPEDALRTRIAAEAAVRRAGGGAELEAELAHHLGAVYNRAGRFDEAITAFRRSIELEEQARGAEHPAVAKSLLGLANVLFEQGQLDEAAALNERALAIYEAGLGPEHPQIAVPLNNLANVYLRQGRGEDARRMQERVLAIVTATYGEMHPRVADAHDNLANSLGDDVGAVRRHRERALEIRRAVLAPDHYDIGISEHNLGDLLKGLGEYEQAVAHYQRAFEIWEKSVGAEHLDLAYPLTGLADSLVGLGRFEEAAVAAERAVALRETAGGDPGGLGLSRFVLAHALWGAGRDRARAIALVRQAHAAFVAYGEGAVAEAAQTEAWLAEHARSER